jgi:Transketolase, C-terminal subunit
MMVLPTCARFAPKHHCCIKTKTALVLAVRKCCDSRNNDLLTIAATGVTVFEALKAADELQKENISIRVVDCYSIHPVDAATLKKCMSETRKNIDHGGRPF